MISTGGEGEEREKVNLKIFQAGELNPGLQRERQEHWPLYQGGLLITCKVIYTKYSKHWPYTVAHTFECVCRKC